MEKMTFNEMLNKWIDMVLRLLASVPDRVVDWLNGEKRDEDEIPHDLSTKIIPFVIIALSGASITNLSTRAAAHHPGESGIGWGPYLVGVGLAVLVPVTVFVAIRIRNKSVRNTVWTISFIFAAISGTIQTQIYAPGVKETATGFALVMLWLESFTFGYGVPASEVLLAWVESNMLKQHEEDVAIAKQQKKDDALAAEEKHKREEDEAEAKRIKAQNEQAESAKRSKLDDLEIEERRLAMLRNDEIEREKSQVQNQLRLKKADSKVTKKVSKKVSESFDESETIDSDGGLQVVNNSQNSDPNFQKKQLVTFFMNNPGALFEEAANHIGSSKGTVSKLVDELTMMEILHAEKQGRRKLVNVNGGAEAFLNS